LGYERAGEADAIVTRACIRQGYRAKVREKDICRDAGERTVDETQSERKKGVQWFIVNANRVVKESSTRDCASVPGGDVRVEIKMDYQCQSE